jgi:NADH-quinone oxidoreductase subunit C
MQTIDEFKSDTRITAVEAKRDNLLFLSCDSGQLMDVLNHLRDIKGYRHLVMISAVDRIEAGLFQLTYLLHDYQSHADIGLRVEVNRDKPLVPSIHHLWPTAHVYQRELREMFGIDFPESPRVNEPMMLEGWDNIPPMRKEFDTKQYSENTFFPRAGRKTADPKQHRRNTGYPSEAKMNDEIKRVVRNNRDQS